jgi:hypothetical protein
MVVTSASVAKRDYSEMATRLVVAAIGSKNRWRRVAVMAVVVLALVGGAGFLAVRGVAANQAATLEADWRALQACVLGDALAPGETPETRLALVELAAVAVPMDQRAKPNELPWPSSCAPAAAALSEHAPGAEQGAAELQADARALAAALRDDPAATVDIHKEVARVWSDAARAQLVAAPDPQARLVAPKPAVPLFTNAAFRDQPRALEGELALSSIHPEPAPWGDLRFLVEDKQLGGPPVACTTNGSKPAIDCERVPVQVSKLPSPRLIASVEPKASALYACGDRGTAGVFWPDGRALLPPTVTGVTTYGAVSRADGSATLLARKEGQHDLELVSAPVTGPATEQPSLLASDVDVPEDATIAWDWLVYRSSGKAFTSPHHLMARKLKDFALPTDVGPLPAPPAPNPRDPTLSQPMVVACRTDDALVLRVRGAEADAVAFFSGGRWSAPQTLTARAGVLTCRAHEAVVTTVLPSADGKPSTIEQSRCDLSGCTATRLDLKDLLIGTPALVPEDAAHLSAADVDGRLALVWSAGATGGLRLRVAPLERIKATPDAVIFDGRDESGASRVGLVTELRLLPASSYAVLFVNTTVGARAFRIDSDGKLTPVRVSAAH